MGIERDREYQQYSYSLQTLLYGSIQVRRNLFHALIIINPFHVTKEELDLLYQLVYMQGLPMRIGFLFYNEYDNGHIDNNEKRQNVQVYQMIHLFQILSEYYETPTLFSIIKYWLNHIHDEIIKDNKNNSEPKSKFMKIKK